MSVVVENSSRIEERGKMKRWTQILLIILGILVVFFIIMAIGGWQLLRRPFPETAGTISLPGLQEEVEVYRDEWGVAHIYAQNEPDLFFAQGYVHAQERFWQMEFWRHLGQGRLSEIVGEPTVELDTFIRTIGWNRLAERSRDYYAAEAPEAMAVMEAYAAGVNAYLGEQGDAFSINQTILGMVNEPWEIEPWEPLDTISWGMVMAYQLSHNWEEELDRVNLIRDLGEAQALNLLPPYPYDTRPVIAPTDELISDLEGAEEATLPLPAGIDWTRLDTNIVGVPPGDLAFGAGPFIGSNNWVVSGEHTESGQPLLANDPHLGVQMPSIWYEIGLHTPDWAVTGFSFAGTPGVIIGHNDHIAWGVTTSRPDVQDLYIERINPNNPRQYEVMGAWEEMEVIEEVIHVNGGEDITLEVLATRHGPIINDVVDGARDVLALRWAAAEPATILQAVIQLNRAENWDEFREALRYWDMPSQNFVYADVEGNIGYQMPGRVPVRRNGDGLVPVPGWTDEYEWEGWLPHTALPAVLNPERGFIVTANNAVTDEAYPYYLARDYADGDRAGRIETLLEEAIAAGPVGVTDMARIQFDSRSLLAESYLPLFADLSSEDPEVQAAIERLRGWDLQEREDSVPATIFELFYRQLARLVLMDEVGEEHFDAVAGRIFFHELAQQPAAVWWDDVSTPAVETQEEILLRAVEDAVAWLEDNVGPDPAGWTWGQLHTITLVSDPLGQSGIGPLESLVNRGPYPVSGGSSLVNANSWRWDNPAAVSAYPSLRMVVDLDDLDRSRGVIPGGQSGHPLHRHYDDQIDLWLRGETIPLWHSRAAVEAAAQEMLVLQPPE
jgi:penicillin amidase